jgi:hypothetical protein
VINRIDALRELGMVDQQSVDLVTVRAREAIGPVGPRTQEPSRRRRASTGSRRALAAAIVLAIVGALLLVARPWGSGAADAALLRRAALAITPPAHTIEHILQIQRQGSSVLTTESWQSIDEPGTLRWRQTTTRCGAWTTDESSTLNEQQWFDPDQNRILRMPLRPAEVRASWPQDGPRTEFDPTVPFAAALKRGDAHVVGATSIDRIAVTAISWPTGGATDPTSQNVLYVETTTGAPVAYTWGGGKLDATGGVAAHQRFLTYEFLPQTPESTVALSETAAHPQAAGPVTLTRNQFDRAYQEAELSHCGSVG